MIDLDTGREVKKVVRLNTDTGHIVATAPDGSLYEAVGRFRFEERRQEQPKIVMGAPQCIKCGSSLTLPGDDLCPGCRARDRNQRNRMVVEKSCDPFSKHKCELCDRVAAYSVADEVETTPQVAKEWMMRRTVLFSTGATVGRRWYCDFHFQPPRILDARGEVVEQVETRLRPQ